MQKLSFHSDARPLRRARRRHLHHLSLQIRQLLPIVLAGSIFSRW